jgi:hypothetical protein
MQTKQHNVHLIMEIDKQHNVHLIMELDKHHNVHLIMELDKQHNRCKNVQQYTCTKLRHYLPPKHLEQMGRGSSNPLFA